jgi:hypothetical protein
LGAPVNDVSLIKNAKWATVSAAKESVFDEQVLLGIMRDGKYVSGATACSRMGEHVIFPDKTLAALEISAGEKVFVTPL